MTEEQNTDHEKDELYNRLLDIVANGTGEKREKLGLRTVITDLGCDGIDAMELLDDIEEEFQIDFSKFEYHRYFNDEGLFGSLKELLSIEDLFEAVKTKSWKELEYRPIKSSKLYPEWPLMLLLVIVVIAILANFSFK